MDEMSLLIDLHVSGKRQGPGSDRTTQMALDLMLSASEGRPDRRWLVADIGCGTGASTLYLAQQLQASIKAVDFLPDFLTALRERAIENGMQDCIETIASPMETLPFEEESLDVIWSEGAIYNMGFARGVEEWRRFLVTGGMLVVSEITWSTDRRPAEIEEHWCREYPEIDVASAKIRILEENGFMPVGYFLLPPSAWLENYYLPLQARFQDFLSRNEDSDAARAIVAAEENEIRLYRTYHNYFSYGMYVAKKT